MGKSLVPQRVKNTGIDLLIGAVLIGGAVLAVGYGNKKFNILGKFVQGVSSIGSSIGQATGAGIANIPIGIGQGVTSATIGTQGTNLTRGSLGLDPDTSTCTHIPFTNIPIPGSKCSVPSNANLPTDTTQPGPLKTTSPGEPVTPATQQQIPMIPTVSQLNTSVPTNTFRFDNGSSLTVTQGTQAPVGTGSFTFNGKPLISGAIARTSSFGVGTLTTTAGGTRNIIGSSGLFSRLQQNLSNSAQGR